MRKIVIHLTLFLLSTHVLYGEMDVIHTDVRMAAFYPQGSLFRSIYGNWQVDYELEIGKIFLKNYEAWANINFLTTSGQTILGNSTTFKNCNISVGGKYIFRFKEIWKLYLGLGINDALVYAHNYSSYVKKHVHKNGVGGVFKLGVYVEPMDHLFIDVFADYLYQPIHFDHWQQIGGLKIGSGVGFCY